MLPQVFQHMHSSAASADDMGQAQRVPTYDGSSTEGMGEAASNVRPLGRFATFSQPFPADSITSCSGPQGLVM